MSEPKNSHTPGGAGGLAGSVAGAGTAALASGSAGASGSGFNVVNSGAEARAGGAPLGLGGNDSDGKDGAPARPMSCLTSSAPWELRMRRLSFLASDAEGVACAEPAPTWNQREDARD